MTRTRYGVSPWIEEFPKTRRPDFPRLKGAATFPIVIVGGGLAGVLTAYAFSAAGIRVALVEAERLGQNGAGRGPGILQGEAASSFRDVEKRHGRKAARAVFEASRRAVLDLATTARRLGVKDVETHEAWRVLGTYAGDEKALARETALRRDAGLDAIWLKSATPSGKRASKRHAPRFASMIGARHIPIACLLPLPGQRSNAARCSSNTHRCGG